MRVASRSALFALLPALVSAVSLSDMTPRAENLPDECDKIYTSQISGCGIPDFKTQSCTDTCVKAMQALVGPIKEACGGQGVTGQNLIVAFLAGVGPEQICPNAASIGASSNAAPQQSSTPSPSPSSTPKPASTATTPKEAQTSSKVQSTSLLVDTSSAAPVSSHTRTRTPAFSGTTRATSLTAEQSFAPTTSVDGPSMTSMNEQTSTDSSEASEQSAAEDRSGGGSPFDEEGNMFSGADSLSSTSVLVSLGIALVVVAFLFR